MTQKGVGRELLDVFLATALTEKSAYIPKTLSDDLEASVFVDDANRYQRREVLGKGAFGEVSRFQEQNTGRKVVLKKIHNSSVETEDLDIETRLFQKVYDHLGKPYFGIDATTGVLPPHVANPHARVVLPEIPGADLVQFAAYYPNYNEQMLFNSLFNFLWALHFELKIAHRDCHVHNIMVLDGLYNVFFIDYGLAFEVISDGKLMAEKRRHFISSMHKDLTTMIVNLFYLRKAFNRGSTVISLADLIQTYNLERWRTYAFAHESMEDMLCYHVK
ncbi:hypothetical protein AAEX28_04465 [Lentisphaerota bacterium WC36G]|nr:hypothetical protein LJT99_07330 [Lentisphaerae bacterium WC36]